MYYIYIGKNHDLSNPDKVIVEENDKYFERSIQTSWDLLDEFLVRKLKSGDDDFYSIEDHQFDEIIDKWGGSKTGYRNLNVDHLFDNFGYGDEYDE